MSLPQVSIQVTEGGLGRVSPLADGIAALLITGAKTKTTSARDTLYTRPHAVYGLADAEKISITQSAESTAYNEIKNFYNQAGQGSKIWVRLIPKDETFANIFNTGGIAESMVATAGGEIRLLGLWHAELTSRSVLMSATGGLKGNIHAAVPLAEGYAQRMKEKIQPLQILIAGNHLENLDDLTSYTAGSASYVSLLIGGAKVGTKEAALGFTLGLLARMPVQRSLARVKNGSLALTQATFSNGEQVEIHSGKYANLHTRRYLFFRNYTGLVGYYVADDLNLTAGTQDASNIATRRVLDKAIRLTHQTYIQEIGEEVLLEDGKLSAAYVKYLEGKIENALNETMVNAGALSEVNAFVDPAQNVLSTNRVDVELSLVPVGYTKRISIRIGLTNSQNA